MIYVLIVLHFAVGNLDNLSGTVVSIFETRDDCCHGLNALAPRRQKSALLFCAEAPHTLESKKMGGHAKVIAC